MAILVTGAAGFIGSHVAQRLLARGETVVGLDNVNDYFDPRIKEARLVKLVAQPNGAPVLTDLREDIGEKKMVVFTAEGTLRGYSSRCADVTKSLQAVRPLVASQHAVCFGLGAGDERLIINKVTGEINAMRDDGVNYLQDLIIVPPEQFATVAAELAAIQQSFGVTIGDPKNDASFGRQGR